MYEINYVENATVNSVISMSFKPEEFLNCASEEEVIATIDSMFGSVDYGECSDVIVNGSHYEIPVEFWNEWHKLKNQ